MGLLYLYGCFLPIYTAALETESRMFIPGFRRDKTAEILRITYGFFT